MKRLTDVVHDLLRESVRIGDVVVDATAGNGHDTVVLARLVGESGKVLAFDVQSLALAQTRERLDHDRHSNVELIQACHSEVRHHLPGGTLLGAACFNLGYLPGGDKGLVTQPETSVRALSDCFAALRDQGVLTVVAYVGHPGGVEEAEAVEVVLDGLAGVEWIHRDAADDGSVRPRLMAVRKSA